MISQVCRSKQKDFVKAHLTIEWVPSFIISPSGPCRRSVTLTPIPPCKRITATRGSIHFLTGRCSTLLLQHCHRLSSLPGQTCFTWRACFRGSYKQQAYISSMPPLYPILTATSVPLEHGGSNDTSPRAARRPEAGLKIPLPT